MAVDYKISVDDAMKIAMALQREGKLREAEEIYIDILEAAPGHVDALHFYGILKHQSGESERGLKLLRSAISLNPDSPDMRSNLGNVLKELGRLDEAEGAYRAAIDIDDSFAKGHCNLSVVFRAQNKYDDAESALKKAIELDPQCGEAYHNLGNLHRDRQDWDKAIQCFIKAIEHDGYRMVGGKAAENLANMLIRSGRPDDAGKVLRRWLTVEPNNAIAKHMQACIVGNRVPERASDDYVRQIFDRYAGEFDQHLRSLNYRAPEFVGDDLRTRLGKPAHKLGICDLGCGTGLMAEYLKPYAARLVGVDLSASMLNKAQARGYHELVEAELIEFLHRTTERFDLITCIDTFVYFGELKEAFQACADALNSGGWLCITVERCNAEDNGKGYRLEHHGRYSHHQKYVTRLLQDARICEIGIKEVTLRMENGQPVAGFIITGHLAT